LRQTWRALRDDVSLVLVAIYAKDRTNVLSYWAIQQMSAHPVLAVFVALAAVMLTTIVSVALFVSNHRVVRILMRLAHLIFTEARHWDPSSPTSPSSPSFPTLPSSPTFPYATLPEPPVHHQTIQASQVVIEDVTRSPQQPLLLPSRPWSDDLIQVCDALTRVSGGAGQKARVAAVLREHDLEHHLSAVFPLVRAGNRDADVLASKLHALLQ